MAKATGSNEGANVNRNQLNSGLVVCESKMASTYSDSRLTYKASSMRTIPLVFALLIFYYSN